MGFNDLPVGAFFELVDADGDGVMFCRKRNQEEYERWYSNGSLPVEWHIGNHKQPPLTRRLAVTLTVTYPSFVGDDDE
jgi:hypothetical protein